MIYSTFPSPALVGFCITVTSAIETLLCSPDVLIITCLKKVHCVCHFDRYQHGF